MNYHVGIGGKQEGPFSEEEIRQRIADGRLSATDLCWTSGWPEWKPLQDVFPTAFNTTQSQPAAPPAITVATRGPDGRSLYEPSPTGAPPPPAVATAPKTEPLAIAALVMGFIPFCLIWIGAIICGHIARSRIAKSNGQLTGAGMALTGLICGYAWLALGLIYVVVMVVLLASSPHAFR